jgi:uncharacterized alpha-E superfamily protein
MMLSRVADSMFWMSRYIERAENIARFIDVNTYLMLDLGDSVGEQWRPLVAITGDEGNFRERYKEPSRENVMRFLTFDESYPNSIVSCLANARENARIIRENISTAMWEVLNKFYLLVREEAAKGSAAQASEELYAQVRTLAQLFVGVTDGTLSHGEGWHFARMGRLIERADKSSRILDVRYFLLLPKASDVGTPLDVVQWSALLRSTSALDMYRAKHGRLSPTKIAEFLLLDADFPRAVRHCVDVAERSLRSITGTPVGTFQNSAEKTLGRLRSELDYAAIDDVLQEGLHEFIDRLQRKLNDVGEAIRESLLSPTLAAPKLHVQTQAQTQRAGRDE